MSTDKHNETAAYIDKNGDLIFTSLGDKQNALCVKDRSSINSHAIAESYRPQILCNRQCAKCSITFVGSSYSGYWIITTCGVKHYFNKLYVWQDGQYKVQVDMQNSVTQEEWDDVIAGRHPVCNVSVEEMDELNPLNPGAAVPAARPPEEGGWDGYGRDMPGSFLLGKE